MMKKLISLLLLLVLCLTMLVGCGPAKEQIVIYTCANDRRIAYMTEVLTAEFPQYDFIIEYQSTSKLSAKLLAEGVNTDADIIHDLSYLNLEQLNREGLLADVSGYDLSNYVPEVNLSDNYLIEARTGGAIMVNLDVLEDKGLEKPTCYEDLLKPEYKGLISMPDPKSSGTGYMFYKSLVNAWGEEKALEYFEALSVNVLQFTSSGNGPVNALVQEEVAIGLGMTANGSEQMEMGANLEILFFEEGSPYTMYGQTIIKGKETNPAVKEVFDFLFNEYIYMNGEKFGSETVWTDRDYTTEYYPKDVTYSDMSNDTVEEKERLLALWSIT